MARPKKRLNKKQISEVETLASVLTTEQMADYFGIAKPTFFQILERQPIVNELYKRGRSKSILFAGNNLLKKVREGDTTSTIFFLKTQGGWREKESTNITVNNENKLGDDLAEFMKNKMNEKTND